AFKEVTPAGALANHWWIGSSLMAAPVWLPAHALCRLFPGLGEGGFFGLYAAAFGWVSVLLACLTCLIADRLMRSSAGDRPGPTWPALVAVWVGTPLLWYEYRFPIGTHVAGAFCVGVLCFLLLGKVPLTPGWHGLACGTALGLAAACRLQHIV